MLDYTIITKHRVYESEPDDIYNEQQEKRAVLNLNGADYLCHFFDSPFFNDSLVVSDIDTAIQYLAIKDGVDMVLYSNGNYGFVAYYSGCVNGFEIIG